MNQWTKLTIQWNPTQQRFEVCRRVNINWTMYYTIPTHTTSYLSLYALLLQYCTIWFLHRDKDVPWKADISVTVNYQCKVWHMRQARTCRAQVLLVLVSISCSWFKRQQSQESAAMGVPWASIPAIRCSLVHPMPWQGAPMGVPSFMG